MTEHNPAPGPPTRNPVSGRRWGWPTLGSGAIIAGGTIAVYSHTFSVPLVLDDIGAIANNASIHRLWPIWAALKPPEAAGVGGRPLLNLSYAINYALGGNAVFGYHLVNLIIHVLASWVLFALVRHTLKRPVLAKRFGSHATVLALAVSAVWAWHPVQTESVTYLAQRAESLMGLFYLLVIYCFARGTETVDRTARRTWFSASVLACLAGVATKEVIATAPLATLLYDRTFLSGTFSAAWRRHRAQYLGLAATWLPLACLMIGFAHPGLGFDQGVAWWAYGLTECRVIVNYLTLSLWPNPLVFDYGWYGSGQLSELWAYALVLGALLTAAVLSLRRWPTVGFAAGWFFLILAPTSSVIPIGGQPMSENRLYLPLAGVVALVVLGTFAWGGRRTLPIFAAVAAGLALASVQRNRAYATELTLWTDTIAKNPDNARAHNNLGNAWFKMAGRLDEAIAEYETTVRLKPDSAEAHYNLGNALLKMPGGLYDAIAQYEEALRLKPDFAAAHYNLAIALFKKPGAGDEARAHFDAILRLALQPNNDAARQILAKMKGPQP